MHQTDQIWQLGIDNVTKIFKQMLFFWTFYSLKISGENITGSTKNIKLNSFFYIDNKNKYFLMTKS